MSWQLWIAGAVFAFGAQVMGIPKRSLWVDALENMIGNLCMLVFAGVGAVIWYKSGYWSAAIWMSAGLPGIVARDLMKRTLEIAGATPRANALLTLYLVSGPIMTIAGAVLTAVKMLSSSS